MQPFERGGADPPAGTGLAVAVIVQAEAMQMFEAQGRRLLRPKVILHRPDRVRFGIAFEGDLHRMAMMRGDVAGEGLQAIRREGFRCRRGCRKLVRRMGFGSEIDHRIVGENAAEEKFVLEIDALPVAGLELADILDRGQPRHIIHDSSPRFIFRRTLKIMMRWPASRVNSTRKTGANGRADRP
jgi:hypothetical protein